MKISRLIFLGIFLILLLFTITTIANYKQWEKVRENADYFSVSSTIVRQSNEFLRNILNMERDLKGFAATGNKYLLQNYDSAVSENRTLIADLSAALIDSKLQRGKFEEIQAQYNHLISFHSAYVSPLLTSDPIHANAFIPIKQDRQTEEEKIIKQIQQEFREFLNLEYSNREERKDILKQSEQQTKIISVLFTALSIVVGFVIAVLLAKYISKRISQLVTIASSIAAGNYKGQFSDSNQDELSELTRSLNQMAATLHESISLLEKKNKELDQFAHIVSHDLKAPLRGIDSVITWIEEDHGHEIPPKVSEYLALIKARIKRSESLIQGILTYARIGREVTEAEKVDVGQLVYDVADNVSMKPGIDILIDPHLPTIQTERIPLTQIFGNLISNAIKYHDKDKGHVKVYACDCGEYFEFFVEDDGPGIEPRYFDRLFVIFQTLHSGNSYDSSGVGLAIVKKILDDRKEQVKVSSEPGKGSIFSFTWRKT